MENLEREIIVAVMGVTGTGKSYFIREVSGILGVGVSSGLHSCTTDVQLYSFPYAGVKVTLVDTPGFNDTTKRDTQVLTEICAWMSSSYKDGKRLSGIIYLHNVNDVRMGGSSIKYVRTFQKLCGPNALPNVLLATTHWSNIDKALGEKRECELRSGDFWGGLIREGASVKRFMGTRESGLELIDKLIENQPKPLQIQHEMVVEGKAMAQTNTGKFMNEELIALQKKYQKELEDMRRDLQKAIREKDDLLKEILEEQRAQSRKRLEDAASEKKYLADMSVDMMKELEVGEKKREEERQRNGKAVIAVASEDIGGEVYFHTLFTSYTTKGRLINDTNDAREFKKESFEVKINYQSNILTPVEVTAKIAARILGTKTGTSTVMNSSNYITYGQGYYQCRPSLSVVRGSQHFNIFTKC